MIEAMQKVAGPFWPLVKKQLRGLRIKIDTEAKTVSVTLNGKCKVMTIEQFQQQFKVL